MQVFDVVLILIVCSTINHSTKALYTYTVRNEYKLYINYTHTHTHTHTQNTSNSGNYINPWQS